MSCGLSRTRHAGRSRDFRRVATDLVRQYRERMHDYASMRALDVWYDRIDLQKFQDRTGRRDYRDFIQAIREGRIQAMTEE
ncbi:DUF2252 family protein [Paraburkholderia phymatum]|uniref:DUF2252 family protein n=1 Tax=Paraburkholderia phymatum TaxID=148447 RepID=A0ACC6U468_9BURK